MTRDQLQRYFRLGTIRNTNRVLKRLEGYLQSFRDGYSSVYYLSSQGKEEVNCKKIRKKGGHVEHYLMRNQFWLFEGCPSEWRNEVMIDDTKTSLICDAMYKSSLQYRFLEVDNQQNMKKNREKVRKYKALMEAGGVTHKLGHFPVLVWLTTSVNRKKQLTEACQGLPCIIYTLSDIY